MLMMRLIDSDCTAGGGSFGCGWVGLVGRTGWMGILGDEWSLGFAIVGKRVSFSLSRKLMLWERMVFFSRSSWQ